jgi:hypothetical protein
MCRNLDLWFLLFYCLLSKFFFPPLFAFFLLSVLLSFLFLSNWFFFLSSFVFPLLFWHCFIHVSLAHVVSSLAYPNLLGTKRLGCCCCCINVLTEMSIIFLMMYFQHHILKRGKLIYGRRKSNIIWSIIIENQERLEDLWSFDKN